MINIDVLSLALNTCEVFNHTGRDQLKILASITEELGELSKEVLINRGEKPDEPGKDGVVGESIDLIIGALDMIYSETGTIDPEVILPIMANKLAKWVDKYYTLKT